MKQLIVKFKLWYYRKEINQLIAAFDDPKYPRTGIALTPDDLIKRSKQWKWRTKKTNNIIRFCVRMGIIQDHPMNKKGKKFFYILNPEFLK